QRVVAGKQCCCNRCGRKRAHCNKRRGTSCSGQTQRHAARVYVEVVFHIEESAQNSLFGTAFPSFVLRHGSPSFAEQTQHNFSLLLPNRLFCTVRTVELLMNISHQFVIGQRFAAKQI